MNEPIEEDDSAAGGSGSGGSGSGGSGTGGGGGGAARYAQPTPPNRTPIPQYSTHCSQHHSALCVIIVYPTLSIPPQGWCTKHLGLAVAARGHASTHACPAGTAPWCHRGATGCCWTRGQVHCRAAPTPAGPVWRHCSWRWRRRRRGTAWHHRHSIDRGGGCCSAAGEFVRCAATLQSRGYETHAAILVAVLFSPLSSCSLASAVTRLSKHSLLVTKMSKQQPTFCLAAKNCCS